MAGRGSIWIAVSPAVAYAAVADLTRMGEWSPENCSGAWTDPDTRRGRRRDLPRPEPRSGGRMGDAQLRDRGGTAQPCSRSGWPLRAKWARPGATRSAPTVSAPRSPRPSTGTGRRSPDEGFRGRVGRLPIAHAAALVLDRQRHLQDQVDRTLATLKRGARGRGLTPDPRRGRPQVPCARDRSHPRGAAGRRVVRPGRRARRRAAGADRLPGRARGDGRGDGRGR